MKVHIVICQQCTKSFEVSDHPKRRKYCGISCTNLAFKTSSRFKGENNPAWAGGGVTFNCRTCGKVATVNKHRAEKEGRGIFCSKPCFIADMKTRRAELTNNWAGDNVKYEGLHGWRIRNFGNPVTCEHCGLLGEKSLGLRGQRWNIEWANISGEYKRDESDWIGLCKKCHMAYDNTGEKIWTTRRQNQLR